MGDVRFTLIDNELAIKYQEANDAMDMALDETIDSLCEVAANESEDSYTEPEELGPTRDLRVGDEIEVFWPLDGQYYPGSVSEYSEDTGKHRIDYDDGEVENLK